MKVRMYVLATAILSLLTVPSIRPAHRNGNHNRRLDYRDMSIYAVITPSAALSVLGF